MNHTPSNDDNLERFFERYLGDGKSLPPEPWNTPDDEVWDAVATQLAPPPERRRLRVFWVIIGLLSVGLVALSVWVWQLQHEMRHIKEQYAVEHSRRLSANGGEADDRAPSVAAPAMADVLPPAVSPAATVQHTSSPSTSALIPAHDASPHSPKGQAATETMQYKVLAASLAVAPLPTRLKAPELVPPSRSLSTVAGVAYKDTPLLDTPIEHGQSAPHDYEVRQLRRSFARSLTLDVDYYAPLLVNFASVQSPHIILNRGYAPWSWMQGIGAQLTYRIDHRLGVSVGAYSNKLSKQFLAYSIDRYDAQKDVPTGGGGIQHSTSVSVNTPVGHIREQISFRRRAQDEPLPHNSTMVVEGVMLHNLKIQRVPVRMQYDLIQHRGLAITAGLGLVYNRVATDKYDVAYNIWIKDQVVSRHVYSVALETPMRRHIWDGTASLQVSQRIGNQLNIHIGTAYEHSLAPIYTDPAALNKGRLQGLQVTMGVGYTLSPQPREVASTIF